jgi:hypothetical protein
VSFNFFITFSSIFLSVFKNVNFSYKFVCYSWNCNRSFIFACFHIFLASWVIKKYFDVLLKLLYLALKLVLQEPKKGETRVKRRNEHTWVKNLYLSETQDECKHMRDWVRNIYFLSTNQFLDLTMLRQVTTWQHREETIKL